MAFSVVSITHAFNNPDGTPASGSCIFTLEKRMSQPGQSIVPGVSVTANLNASGQLAASLYSTQDPTTVPTDVTWRVDIRVNNEEDGPYFFPLPPSSSPVDLYSLLPQTAQAG